MIILPSFTFFSRHAIITLQNDPWLGGGRLLFLEPLVSGGGAAFSIPSVYEHTYIAQIVLASCIQTYTSGPAWRPVYDCT